MNKILKKILLGIFIIILIPGIIAIPPTLNIQGKLTDNSGTAVSGNYDMTFRFYNSSSGGSSIFTIANKTVSVNLQGIYHALISGINLSFSEEIYVGVTINNDEEMIPRMNLTSSPYAFRSNITDNLNSTRNYELQNLTANGYIGIGTSTPSAVLDIIGSENKGFMIIGDGTGNSGGNPVITIDRTTDTAAENAHGIQDWSILKKAGSYNSFDTRVSIPDGTGDNYNNKHFIGFQCINYYNNTEGVFANISGFSTIGMGCLWSLPGSGAGTTIGRLKHIMLTDINIAGSVENQYGIYVQEGEFDAGTNGNWLIYNDEDNATIYTKGLIGTGVTQPFNGWNIPVTNGMHIEGLNPALGITDTAGEDWALTAGGSGIGIYGDTDNTFRFFIDNTGEVGIGTIAPASKLEVVGSINASGGFKVNGTVGVTDSSSYWLCSASDCSSTCQVQITGGIITGCA